MNRDNNRIVFLDWLRVIACFMVMVVHACEAFYFNDNGEFCIRSVSDARWVSVLDSMCRAAVPLFVLASSYLLFPLTKSTGEFFRRRFMRIVVPFALWACVYCVVNAGGWKEMLFNFPMTTGGHLWFVPMLLGLYLLMPLLSPWAEKASEKEVRGWLLLWLFTTMFPFWRKLCGVVLGDPSFGAVPYLWGECPWNGFGTFHYVSGFFGYMLLGFWLRKFVSELSWPKTLAVALPLWFVGWVIVAAFFYFRIPAAGGYPVVRPYAEAVNLEMSWEFCGFGVVLTAIAYFLVIRKFTGGGRFYERIVRPASESSYGTYLMHMLLLAPIVAFYRKYLPMPITVFATALSTFVLATLASVLIDHVVQVGRFLILGTPEQKAVWFSFAGRATMKEFWAKSVLFLVCAFLLLPAFIGLAVWFFLQERIDCGVICILAGGLCALVSGIAVVPVMVRRFHDRGMSGWWVLWFALMCVTPGVGVFAALVAVFILGFLEGLPEANEYGEAPKRDEPKGSETVDVEVVDGTPPSPPTGLSRAFTRLAELRALKENGLLSDEEYEVKKRQVISEI